MGGGAQRPVLCVNELKKDGCAQRTGAHVGPKSTSLSYIYLGYFVCVCVCVCVCGVCGYLYIIIHIENSYMYLS